MSAVVCTDGDSAQRGERREDEERSGQLYVFQNKKSEIGPEIFLPF